MSKFPIQLRCSLEWSGGRNGNSPLRRQRVAAHGEGRLHRDGSIEQGPARPTYLRDGRPAKHRLCSLYAQRVFNPLHRSLTDRMYTGGMEDMSVFLSLG